MILLDRLIRQFPGAKRQTLKRMVQDRRVSVNGIVAAALKQPLAEGDVVRILPRGSSPAALPFAVVFEDRDVLVIDKPAGLLTSTVPREPRPTALAILQAARPTDKIGLVHRLDRDASGLLIFSKNQLALNALKRQFARHSAARIYLAMVSPPPLHKRGRIESALVEWADGCVHSTRVPGRGRHAVTEYEQIRRGGVWALLRVKLHTGRKHQIRAHLSELGCPIVGDEVYHGKPHAGGLMLAAIELQVDHPRTGKPVKWQIEPPGRMRPR
ncbi:MAG: RluA family pseudouridine synthase [Tepidisphaeraceae bacterium]|jgi:23S rRNA pseudouridine1911/1915/1917 synthase